MYIGCIINLLNIRRLRWYFQKHFDKVAGIWWPWDHLKEETWGAPWSPTWYICSLDIILVYKGLLKRSKWCNYNWEFIIKSCVFIWVEEKHLDVVPWYSGETSENPCFSHRPGDLICVLGDYLKINMTTYRIHVILPLHV